MLINSPQDRTAGPSVFQLGIQRDSLDTVEEKREDLQSFFIFFTGMSAGLHPLTKAQLGPCALQISETAHEVLCWPLSVHLIDILAKTQYPEALC